MATTDYARKAARELRGAARRRGYRQTDPTPGRFHHDRYVDYSLLPVERTYRDGTVVVLQVRIFRPLERGK